MREQSYESKDNIDSIPLEDRVYAILWDETTNNPYGTTISHITVKAGAKSEQSIKSILDNAGWAKCSYNKYFFDFTYLDGPDTERKNLSDIDSLAFTAPISLLYFDEKEICETTWNGIYLAFLSTLYKDYPTVLASIAGVRMGSLPAPLIANDECLESCTVKVDTAKSER